MGSPFPPLQVAFRGQRLERPVDNPVRNFINQSESDSEFSAGEGDLPLLPASLSASGALRDDAFEVHPAPMTTQF